MTIKDISAQLPWKQSIGTRPLARIDAVIVHHAAAKANVGTYDFLARAKGYANFHVSKGWGHIAYHYMIDRHGKAYKCFSEAEIGAHAGDWDWNKRAIAICMDGDFTEEFPTPAQVAALWDLLDELCTRRPDLPLVLRGTIKGHKEVRPLPTTCPSNRLMKLVEAYRA